MSEHLRVAVSGFWRTADANWLCLAKTGGILRCQMNCVAGANWLCWAEFALFGANTKLYKLALFGKKENFEALLCLPVHQNVPGVWRLSHYGARCECPRW